MTERVNITLPGALLEHLDQAAASEHTTRSGFIRAAVLERIGRPSVVQETRAGYAPPASPTAPPAREAVLPLLKAFFAARDDVDAAYLFGSTAKSEAGPMSDIDVAVVLPRALDRRARFERGLDLAGRLGEILGVERVDVIELNDAGIALAHEVVTTGVLVADRAGKAAQFELETLRKYEDYLPVIEAHERALIERIRGGGFAR